MPGEKCAVHTPVWAIPAVQYATPAEVFIMGNIQKQI